MSDCNEILPGLWIGNAHSCAPFEGRVMCVLEHHPCNPHKCLHLRILNDNGEASRAELTRAARIVNNWMSGAGKASSRVPVLVHCGAGVERSPLVVAWYLHLYKDMTLEEAYRLIISKRPEAQDRQHWIEKPLFEGSVMA